MKKWLDKYNDGGEYLGTTNKGFNYNGAWGGTMQLGGSLPGAVGFMYARTQGAAPSNGPYAKKTKASAQNGKEMKYYQAGLDWKPRNISKNGSWLDKYDEAQDGIEKAKSDATYVKQPRTDMPTMAEAKKQEEADRFFKAIANQPVVQSAKTVTNPVLEEQQRRRIARVAADKYGMNFNEETGKVEKALNFSPQADKTLRKAAENIVEPMIEIEGGMGAANLIKAGLKSGWSSALNFPIVKNIDKKIVYPIQFRKEIAELKKLHAAAPERFNTGEAAERLKHVLGINPKDMDQPILTFDPEGSYYSNLFNNINIDLRQVKQLGKESTLSPKGVYDHEYGHFLQREADRYSENFAKELMKYREELAKYNDPKNLELLKDVNNWIVGNKKGITFHPGIGPQAKTQPTVIDEYVNKVYDVNPEGGFDIQPRSYYGVENADYFVRGNLEQMPHLREMRQTMLERGYIKDRYEPILEETIEKFIRDNPTDRISSFTDPNNKERIKGLQKLFRNLPVAVPAIGAAATLDKKKKGGKVKKDNDGYWNPENWGEPVEIDSNEITMEGVYEPLIGISNTGDVQYMEPGEDYTFDGETVTEYPVTNWLDKYN